MAKRSIEFIIKAIDEASSVFNNIRTSGSNMASSLMTSLSGPINGISELDKGLRSYNNAMRGFNRVAISTFRAVGSSIYDFTKDAINNFSELEYQHAKTMGALATDYDKTAEAQTKFLEDSKKLKQQAMDLGTWGPNGNGSLYTVTDVSTAQTSLVKAGISADNILGSDVLESILKFAGGNDLDIDTATQFAVNLGTVFDKPIEEWGAMLDMVTKAADISVIDVQDIMDSLTYTGGIASGLGRGLEEVLGIIAVMGQAGLRGRVAGTGLQAFFTRILSAGELSDTQIGNAPTEYVGQMYNAFIAEAVNTDGSFKEMDEVAELLNTAMESLDDQEQAWFAKKLFGLYQMKAAYALTGAVDENGNAITTTIDMIENQSEGTNSAKYDLMLGSQYGQIASLGNAWEGIKTDFGSRLSPIVSGISTELFRFLEDPENYKIDFDSLRTKIEESGGLIAEGYGTAISDFATGLMDFGINAVQISGALTPQAEGIFNGIVKLLNGDISGALDDFSKGIEDTNDNIEDLPPELQGAANAASKVITAFTTLSGINLGTNILQTVTSAINMLFIKPFKIAKAILNATNSTTTATSATVSSTSVTVNATSATVNIGSVPLMNVTATVVNVYGGNGNPSNPSNPGGTPTLPGGTPPLLLPGGSGNIPTLPGGSGNIPTLPGGSGNIPTLPNGKVTTLYDFGGKFMTAGDIAKLVAGYAAKIGLTAAAVGYVASQPDKAQSNVAYQYGFGTDYENYLGENYKNISSVAEFFHDMFGTAAGKWTDGMDNYKVEKFMENEVQPATPTEYRDIRDQLFDSIGWLKDYNVGKEYLSGIMDRWYHDNSNGDKYFITAEQYLDLAAQLAEAMGQYIDDNKITELDNGDASSVPGLNTDIYNNILDSFGSLIGDLNTTLGGLYGGNGTNKNNMLYGPPLPPDKTNDGVINLFDKFMGSFSATFGTIFGEDNNINTKIDETNSMIGTNLIPAIEDTITMSDSVLNSTNSVIEGVNSAMSRVQQPILNVSVVTNVDKSGYATSNVSIDDVSKVITGASSRYGASKN